MILKNQVEWALHCCSVLSALPEGCYLSTKTLAEFHGVPKEYLSKALQGLSQDGIVISTLGPTGGYRLAKSSTKITFLDIVEAIEGKRSTFICMGIKDNNPCKPKSQCDKKACGIARIMWSADEEWRKKLRSVTLADLSAILQKDVSAELLSKSLDWLLAQ